MDQQQPFDYSDEHEVAANRRQWLNRFCWGLWIVGMLLIVLSWNDTVSNEVGWGGFAAAMAGSVLNRLWPQPPVS